MTRTSCPPMAKTSSPLKVFPHVIVKSIHGTSNLPTFIYKINTIQTFQNQGNARAFQNQSALSGGTSLNNIYI